MTDSLNHDQLALPPVSRREFLSRHVLGLGSVALATLLQQDKLLKDGSCRDFSICWG